MDFKDDLPIYTQIVYKIKFDICSGKLQAGQKLPSVRELSAEFKVNPNTVQRSYRELESENIVYTKRGLGTFVTKDEEIIEEMKDEKSKQLVVDFIIEMKKLGYSKQDIVDKLKKYFDQEELDV